MFIGTVFASLVWKIKKFRMETSNTFLTSEIFFFRWTFTLLWLLIVYLFKRTLGTILNCQVKVSIISRASWTLFVNQYRRRFRTSPTLIFFYMINMIFWTWLTLFCSIIEIIREIASNTSSWSLKRKRFWTLTFLCRGIELFV